MSERVLYPTRTCFDDAIRFLEMRVTADPRLAFGTDLVLVHGIARVPDDQDPALCADAPGSAYAHGWVEETIPLHRIDPASAAQLRPEWFVEGDAARLVLAWYAGLDAGRKVYVSSPAPQYYAGLRVTQTTRYTIREVLAENQRSNTYGPWRAEYLALCGRSKEAVTDG